MPGARGPADDPGRRPSDGSAALVASVADMVGSHREARWIVEHVDERLARCGPADRAAGAGDGGPGDGGAGDGDGGAVDGTVRHRAALALARRRAGGEPLQYVLGRWPFRSVELSVDRRVLIPRPETEHVVEVALSLLPGERGTGPRCVDLGTGSGAIALSLAVEGGARHPGIEVWATDRSADALDVAAANLVDLGMLHPGLADRVHLRAGSWFEALPAELAGGVDLVVANPPYVGEGEVASLDPEVADWEPRSALVAPAGAGGVDGMRDVEAIVAGAPQWLRAGGSLVVEIAPHQAAAAADAARRAGFSTVTVEPDLTGRLRMVVAGR